GRRRVHGGRGGLLLVRRPGRRHGQGGGDVGLAGGGGGRAGGASGGGGSRRGRRCGRGRVRQAGRVRRARPGPCARARARGRAAGIRQTAARPLQVPAVDPVRRGAAEGGDGE